MCLKSWLNSQAIAAQLQAEAAMASEPARLSPVPDEETTPNSPTRPDKGEEETRLGGSMVDTVECLEWGPLGEDDDGIEECASPASAGLASSFGKSQGRWPPGS